MRLGGLRAVSVPLFVTEQFEGKLALLTSVRSRNAMPWFAEIGACRRPRTPRRCEPGFEDILATTSRCAIQG
jgi:hypothetical protein